MPKGYNGKILRVDLERESISVEEPQEILYCRYLGGGWWIPELKFAGDREKFSKALETYYEMMGWDPDNGVSKRGKLAELDLDWLTS